MHSFGWMRSTVFIVSLGKSWEKRYRRRRVFCGIMWNFIEEQILPLHFLKGFVRAVTIRQRQRFSLTYGLRRRRSRCKFSELFNPFCPNSFLNPKISDKFPLFIHVRGVFGIALDWSVCKGHKNQILIFSDAFLGFIWTITRFSWSVREGRKTCNFLFFPLFTVNVSSVFFYALNWACVSGSK